MAETVAAAVVRIGEILESRTDELARQVTDTIVANVAFYRDTAVVDDADLLASVTNNFRALFASLSGGGALNTAAPAQTGARRADADVPLAAVMAAYRVSVHALWAAVIELAESHPDINTGQVLAATAVLWDVQDAYTDAMTAAYREQAIQRAVADETERAALTEAPGAGDLPITRRLCEVGDPRHEGLAGGEFVEMAHDE